MNAVNNEQRPYMNVVVFDTETNGLDPMKNDMLSIAWVKIRRYTDGSDEIEFVSRAEHFILNDEIENTPETYAINGISDELRHCYGEPVGIVMQAFRTVVRDSYCFAFNIEFDRSFVCKYDEHAFDESIELCEIRKYEGDSVLNSLQRIVYYYFRAFNHWVFVSDHLHSAFDDVMAELVILMHDIFEMNVRKWFISVSEFVPSFGTGKYKTKPVDSICKIDEKFVVWFVFSKDSKCENYLRHYILENWEPSSDLPDGLVLSPFGMKILGE